MSYTLFYVLNGLQNGEEGVYATTTGFGHQLRDGHYFLPDDATDGFGPYASRDAARREAEAARREAERQTATQTWAFPLDGSDPFLINEDEEDDGDENLAVIARGDDPNTFTAKIVGSYETLTLTMSAPDHAAVADVYRHLLKASAKYQ